VVKFKLRSSFTWERNLLRIGVVPSGPLRMLWKRDKSPNPEKDSTAILARFDIVRAVLLKDITFIIGLWSNSPKSSSFP
jgi:hypothetical protein